jgi:hypothetical protein
MKRWRWSLMGACLLIGVGCGGSSVQPGTFERGKAFAEIGPTEPASAPGRGTQSGFFPLGPSSKYQHSDVREGSADVNLVGAAMLPREQTPEPAFPEARGGGEVAFVPGTFTRRGKGITAQNGSNMIRRGRAEVRVLDHLDPWGPQEAASLTPAMPPETPQRREGVGGSGSEGGQ